LTGNGVVAGNRRLLPSGSQARLSECYDAALLDLDGVVYVGRSPVPGAADALQEAAKRGMRLAFVTNNASRTPNAVAAQLTGMGIAATAGDVVTSAQAAAHLIADRFPASSPVLVIGSTALRLALRERGLRPVSTAAEKPVAVVQGYAPDVNYPILTEGALAIRAGAWYVATNADPTLPTARGLQPGNGSLLQVLITATGQRPVVAGKPETPLHAESVERIDARDPLGVGDRLDTDIEAANRAGVDSMLVLTGVSRPPDVLLAPPQQRPTYLAADLSGLGAQHPEIAMADGGFRCGGWTASVADDPASPSWLDIAGSGDPVDALRALCAAAWSVGPPEPAAAAREQAEAVLRRAGWSG
jgi:glycerol-1-phosphatase